MKTDAGMPIPSRCCGNCGKTIRLRGETRTVLCTAVLDVVDADFEDVCVYYVERPASHEMPASGSLEQGGKFWF